MSAFSSVDQAAEPERLIRFLDDSAIGLAAMKHYMATAHALRRPTAPILDVGCGAGHDLVVLADAGIECVGVDPSWVMIGAAATRCDGPLLQARGEHLPFADRSFAGSRIERVLMHVTDPSAVVEEVVRCVQPGGLLTIFEPDWSSLTVNRSSVPTRWVSNARHPSIGADVGDLLDAEGCLLVDRVEERSWWTLDDFERITNIQQTLDRAVARGHASPRETQAWLAEQRRQAAVGAFRAEIAKILWVATTPG